MQLYCLVDEKCELCLIFLEEKGVEATVDGVLGGYGHVNKPDIECSEAFLNSILAERFTDAGKRRRLVTLGIISSLFQEQ